VRNALDRSRLRQANRLFATAMQGGAPIDAGALTLIDAADIRASRVFAEALAAGDGTIACAPAPCAAPAPPG
jgi:hypothetical protein